jgi:SAM-dependent methyltransferase
MRECFPHASIDDPADSTLDILIAGCGSGRQSIETARRYPQARVLAIDLSLRSLSYALRKTRELALSNLDYAQADILHLPGIERTFDVIEASGVLHHLADPMQAWRTLLTRLRPGGFMRIGLYSELARRDIVAARKFIAQGGYKPTVEDIRRYRQELMAQPPESAPAGILTSGDFFATSACRDLLFHVQETRLTLPQIGAFIAETGLEFLGFQLDGRARHRYRTRFPNDHAMTDLAQWHAFEMENPATFSNMYQFWARRPR